VCDYCGTRADIDLQGISAFTVAAPDSERQCPRCAKTLQTVDIGSGGRFLIERCETCFGLFFDPGELQATLDIRVQHAYRIDYQAIGMLAEAKRRDEYSVTYVKCPVCGRLMNRVNFGTRSGVVVDECVDHGVWLDGGELRQLLEWTKAGGMLLHQQVAQKRAAEEQQRRQRRERLHRQRLAQARAAGSEVSFGGARQRPDLTEKLLGRLAGQIIKGMINAQ
jgi:Zn-finger nucleic acid-binding protein